MTQGQTQSLVMYFIISTIAVIFLYSWYRKVYNNKHMNSYMQGYNKMVKAFRAGNIDEIKRLRKESELVGSELYVAYKEGLKRGYADCTDPDVTMEKRR